MKENVLQLLQTSNELKKYVLQRPIAISRVMKISVYYILPLRQNVVFFEMHLSYFSLCIDANSVSCKSFIRRVTRKMYQRSVLILQTQKSWQQIWCKWSICIRGLSQSTSPDTYREFKALQIFTGWIIVQWGKMVPFFVVHYLQKSLLSRAHCVMITRRKETSVEYKLSQLVLARRYMLSHQNVHYFIFV